MLLHRPPVFSNQNNLNQLNSINLHVSGSAHLHIKICALFPLIAAK